MKKRFLAALLFCFPLPTHAVNSNLYIQDARSWDQWDMAVASVDLKTTVCGLYAYSEMTIVFKDTVSTSNSDSLEANCNFYLPPESVVDSLSLWINDKPVPAYLLDKWRAWEIYSNIVNIRHDPAFLTLSGNQYLLRIFPFKQREARKVKINFSSPLLPAGNLLTLRMPLDFVGYSLSAPSRVAWEVCSNGHYSAADMEMIETPGVTIEKGTTNGKPAITAYTSNSKLSTTLMCTFRSPSLADSGYVAEVSTGNNETWFTTTLNVGKALNIKEVSKKRVLFIWNGVESYMNTTSYFQEGSCDYYSSGDCHYYQEISIVNSYQPAAYAEDVEALSKFITSNLNDGDSFNIVLNDGAIKTFSSSNFVAASSVTCLKAASFVLTSPSSDYKESGCLNFSDLMKSALQRDKLTDSMQIVIIDRTSFYSYSLDTTYSYDKVNSIGKTYYHYTTRNQIDVDALSRQLASQLPPGTTIYALANPYEYYGNFKLYDILTRATNGMIIPINDAEYGFRSLSEVMMGKLYPANLSIAMTGDAYVYDVTGYSPATIPIYKPLFITGKIYGKKGNLTLSLKGKFNGRNYQFTKEIAPSSTCALPAQREIWAAKRVADLSKENSQIQQKEAATLSFNNHILTDYTALLALEPGMDSLLSKDGQNQNNDGRAVGIKGNKVPLRRSSTTDITIASGRSGLCITIPNFQHLSGTAMTLKIFDIKGRCVSDATQKLLSSNGTLRLAFTTLSKGSYIVRLCIGKSVVNKMISVL